MTRHRLDRCALHPGPRRSQRDLRDFHHGLLGHADITTTQRYTQYVPAHAARLVDKVARIEAELDANRDKTVTKVN